ncbi:carboxymuconolactone decarboxylase family protein [Natronomonas marina]|jgi:alkylhydroperoxidase/carboxymuconolactone decarboxylase family protein YurZ|uniref:carboxymuconolactone decarboxylase family protein n=1 Tax=Natronomonas marina TaxID=2961939 RepID=UPI0020C9F250|nr:carboxymuconolactone decarboxylase family protein [Natronomonas marina]
MGSGDEHLSTEERELKEAFIERCGYWHDGFDDLLRLDPEFLGILADITAHPLEGDALDRKTKELVHVAVNTSTTHLYEDAIRRHIGNALDHGASVEEVLEVIQMASVLGVHTFGDGVPIVAETLGLPEEFTDEELAEHARLKEQFEELRGFWAEQWEPIMVLDPGFFDHYTRYSAHPAQDGELDAKTRELIFTSIDVATTHLYEPGAAIHINNAIEHGATRDEIVEVLQLAFTIGTHTIERGVPALVEEAEKRDLLEGD